MGGASVPQAVLDSHRSVTLLGDVHGDWLATRRGLEASSKAGIPVILSVGDFGIGPWPGDDWLREQGHGSFMEDVDGWLRHGGCWLLITPGNHENYDTIEASPRDERGWHVLGDRVRALPRGARWGMRGVRFGSLGGAVSVDKTNRVAHRSWWPQETITRSDVAALGVEPLDVLITHEVPAGVGVTSTMLLPRWVVEEAEEGRSLVRDAVESTRPTVVVSGHWHQRRTETLRLPDAHVVRCDVLREEYRPGNAMVLDLEDLGAPLLPLPRAASHSWSPR